MDLIILLVLIAIIIIFFKDFKCFIYAMGIIEIFFQIMNFVKNNIEVSEISSLIDKYIPYSIVEIINRYSTGLFNIILVWLFVICMACLDFYLIKYFFKRK